MTSKKSSNKNLEGLIKPYGGKLINLMASDQESKELKKNSFKTLNCSDRNAVSYTHLTLPTIYSV